MRRLYVMSLLQHSNSRWELKKANIQQKRDHQEEGKLDILTGLTLMFSHFPGAVKLCWWISSYLSRKVKTITITCFSFLKTVLVLLLVAIHCTLAHESPHQKSVYQSQTICINCGPIRFCCSQAMLFTISYTMCNGIISK